MHRLLWGDTVVRQKGRFMSLLRFINWRPFTALLLVAALSGCTAFAPGIPGLAEVDALTVVGTDKTITDHVISFASGKNCSTVRREQGMHYCEEDEPTVEPAVYCYKTLARVTCYDRPDPYKEGYRKIGDNEHNMVKRKTPMRALPEMRQ